MLLMQTIGILMKNSGKFIIFSFVLVCWHFIGASDYIDRTPAQESKKIIRVAVIDTGFDFNSEWKDASKFGLKKPKLCDKGHKDFTETGLQDNHGHGTHVAGIIAANTKVENYCLVIIKSFDTKSTKNSVSASTQAFSYALDIGVDIINYSSGGRAFDLKEYLVIKNILDKGIALVAAAGNNSEKIDHLVYNVAFQYDRLYAGNKVMYDFKITYLNKDSLKITDKAPENSYYPAAYDSRIISVQNFIGKKRVSSSNYGAAFGYSENGHEVYSLLPNNRYGKMTGTSQAAPKVAAKIINNWTK